MWRGTGPTAAAVGSYYAYALSYGNYPSVSFDLEKTLPAGQELYGVVFQYHMNGINVGSVLLESSADGTSWFSLWSKSGQQGDQWSQATAYTGSGQTMLRYTYVPNGRGT